MGLITFTNTRLLSDAANDFKKNGGVYCKAPKGSKDYVEYWTEQKRRCKEGYSVGDIRITGKHYFYLNFCPIKRTADRDGTEKAGWNVIKSKELLFPAFWEVDYNWWWAKEIAMFGMLKEGVAKLKIEALPVKDYTTGKHMGCLKTRRAGFSYKEAADGVWNYNFVPKSKSYYFAAKSDYLYVDGILNKVTDYLNHLNMNTSGYWRKNRMSGGDTLEYRKASYIDKNKDVRGYQSEIIGVIINDPEKVRGKDGLKITYEEAGSFKNLKKALAISIPSVTDGAQLTGQVSIFGTGGEEGEDIEGLEEIFSEPDAYDILAFDNIWEEGMEGTQCGYFVPCTMANQSFMDEHGNVDKVAALAFDEEKRDQKRKLKDPKAIDRRIAEFPRTPSEALQRVTGNFMPVDEAKAQLKRIEKNQELLSSILHGKLTQGKKGIKFEPSSEVHEIHQFPHKNDDDLTGCVTIYHAPEQNLDGRVPPGKYYTVIDPYYKDEATDRTSLWAAYVMKHKFRGDPYGDIIVAKYVARPARLSTAHYNTTLLARLYNSKIQCEIAGGGQGLFDFLRTNKLLHLAEYEPQIFSVKENGINQKNRNYFMNISTDEKKNGLSYFADWLLEPRGLNEHGEPVLNIHMINDVSLLREIIKFNPDPKKNFDRISAMILAMYMRKEFEGFQQQEEKPKSEFWGRKGFGAKQLSSSSYSDYCSLDSLLSA